MKKILVYIVFFFSILSCSPLKGQEFFDTSDASKFFTLSGRIGFNTSNKTFPKGHYNLWNNNSWGTGFNIGVLANLNFKEYLTLQPGIFYQSRSGNYSYLTQYLNYADRIEDHYEMGHLRGYYINIPVMGIVKFNLSEKIKWSVELGPYVQLSLKEMGQDKIMVLYRLPQSNDYDTYYATQNNIDVGIKMGTGLKFYNHYYVGFHYLAGMCNVWENPTGGKNKSWEFSIGYDF